MFVERVILENRIGGLGEWIWKLIEQLKPTVQTAIHPWNPSQ